MESTSELLRRAKEGDSAALDAIVRRFMPELRRMAHGRLPSGARGLIDTGDVVQSTVVRALAHLETFQAEREGAFLAYLRTILRNQIRDEARRAKRTPGHVPIDDDFASGERGPLEQVIGQERLEQCEVAMRRLSQQHRDAVILRVHYGCSYEDIAEATGIPTANAARMAVNRALKRIGEMLKETESPPASRRRAVRPKPATSSAR